MGKFLYLASFIASLNSTYKEAGLSSQRALLETQMMKDELKVLENDANATLFKYTGLLKEDLVYFAYAYPVFAGKLSTKPFSNFKYETKIITIRPEIEFGLWDKETTVSIGFAREF